MNEDCSLLKKFETVMTNILSVEKEDVFGMKLRTLKIESQLSIEVLIRYSYDIFEDILLHNFRNFDSQFW